MIIKMKQNGKRYTLDVSANELAGLYGGTAIAAAKSDGLRSSAAYTQLANELLSALIRQEERIG